MLFKVFWQFPLDVDSQEIYSLLSDLAIFTTTRLIQGATDSANAFQAGMLEVLGNLAYSCVLIWIDDLLVHTKNFFELLQALEKVLIPASSTSCDYHLVRTKDQQ